MQRPRRVSALPRPLLVVAALLAALGLLSMHTLVAPPAAVAASSLDPRADHRHSHGDGTAAAHHHESLTSLAGTLGTDPAGHPCTSCPGCEHDVSSVCALTPAKAGLHHLLLSLSDLLPAPHQLTDWPATGLAPPPVHASPPSLISLSISRT